MKSFRGKYFSLAAVLSAALFNFFFASCVCIDPFELEPTETTKTCYSNLDCMSGEVCSSGKCVAPIDECQFGEKKSCNLRPGDPSCEGKGVQRCIGGKWGPCEPRMNFLEYCNGKDDDCDGQIDETFPEMYKFCRIPGAFGPCSRGEFRKCVAGRVICVSTYKPREESERVGNCDNGIDDDCDGYIDDPERDRCFSCKDGARRQCYPYGQGLSDATVGVGICRAGVQECQNGRWGKCQGAVVPSKEVCGNNLDDDCDGKIDNCSGTCTLGEKKPCYSGPANTRGVGACREGVQVCLSGGRWSFCQGEVLPKPEICDDKIDNDCNGQVDECSPSVCRPGETRSCYSGPSKTANVGACRKGTQVCNSKGEWERECKGEVLPKKEICGNKLDDDCDGKVDNCSVSQFASSSWDKLKPVALWDFAKGQSIRTFASGHRGTVYAVRFSPDGKVIYSVDDVGVIVARQADSGKQSWTANLSKGIYSMAVSNPGGYLVLGHSDGSVSFVSMKNGSLLKSFPAHGSSIFSLAVTGDGKWLATSSTQGEVSVWSLAQLPPKLHKKLSGFSLGVFSVAFSPKGDYLAAGGREGVVKIWTLPGLKESSLPTRYLGVNSLAFFYKSSKLAVGTSDGTIAIWSLSPAPKVVSTLNGKGFGAVYSIAIWPDDSAVLSGHYNNNILIWELANSQRPKYQLGLHTGPISSIVIRP